MAVRKTGRDPRNIQTGGRRARESGVMEKMVVPSEALRAKDGGGDAISTRTEVALISNFQMRIPRACRGFAASDAMLGEKARAFHGPVEYGLAPFRPLA